MEIVLIAALSADGFIASRESEKSTDWTSKEDLRWFAKKTKEIGVCVMGRTTYETIGRALPGRVSIVLSKSGKAISELPPVVIGEPEGSVFVTSSSPQEIVQELTTRGIQQLAVCGGASVYGQFLEEKLVTRLFLTIEPLLVGQGVGLSSKPLTQKLQLVQLQPLSESTIVLEYVIKETDG